MFNEQLDALGFIDDFVRDVNQPTGATERRITRDGLVKFINENEDLPVELMRAEAGKTCHAFYYDHVRDHIGEEAAAALYEDTRPLSKEDETQPFIHRVWAIKALHYLLVTKAGRA